MSDQNRKSILVESLDGLFWKNSKVIDPETGKQIPLVHRVELILDCHQGNEAKVFIRTPMVRVKSEAEFLYDIPAELLNATFLVAGHRMKLMPMLPGEQRLPIGCSADDRGPSPIAGVRPAIEAAAMMSRKPKLL